MLTPLETVLPSQNKPTKSLVVLIEASRSFHDAIVTAPSQNKLPSFVCAVQSNDLICMLLRAALSMYM